MSKTTNSPFIYGQVVDAPHFTDREVESERLEINLLNGIHTMIIAPRRWGKTSLVNHVMNSIRTQHQDVRVLQLDLFSVGSEKEFLELFSRKLLGAVASKWEEQIALAKEFFRQLVPRMTIGTEPNSDWSFSFEVNELKKHVDEILNLGEQLAIKKGVRLIVCIDEFQNLSSFPEFEVLEKRMRAAWQHHKHVSYCMYGSRRHMMEEIFNSPSKPFYRFGDVMALGKIEEVHWVQFISDGFIHSGKKIYHNQAAIIAHLMKNHPWYVQQLAHYTWNLTEKTADENIISTALREVISANTPFFQKQSEILSMTQLNLLKAVAAGEKQFTCVEVMQMYDIGTPNNITKNKKRLIEEDIIVETEQGVGFADPVFEIWFRETFVMR